MKSAFDLAMERLGGPTVELSPDQKTAIQEIEQKFKAKLAEAELAKNDRIAKANGDYQLIQQIQDDYAVEVASINSRRELAKEEIRNQ